MPRGRRRPAKRRSRSRFGLACCGLDMKKNWQGAILGAIGGYLLLVGIARIPELAFLSVLMLPGTLIGGILFNLLQSLNLISTSGGFESLAIGIMFISIINTVIFAIAGAYIQNRYKRRKK